jgi:dihydrofolate reductase
MTISLIAAMTCNRVIGYQNRMPWHLPADLQHFKALTLGKPLIMGRKTFESIGKPLPNRQNIVLTRGLGDINSGVTIAHTLEQALPLASRMYLTLIDTELEGDTFFPEWNPAEWREIEHEDHAPDDKNLYRYSFIMLENIKLS